MPRGMAVEYLTMATKVISRPSSSATVAPVVEPEAAETVPVETPSDTREAKLASITARMLKRSLATDRAGSKSYLANCADAWEAMTVALAGLTAGEARETGWKGELKRQDAAFLSECGEKPGIGRMIAVHGIHSLAVAELPKVSFERVSPWSWRELTPFVEREDFASPDFLDAPYLWREETRDKAVELLGEVAAGTMTVREISAAKEAIINGAAELAEDDADDETDEAARPAPASRLTPKQRDALVSKCVSKFDKILDTAPAVRKATFEQLGELGYASVSDCIALIAGLDEGGKLSESDIDKLADVLNGIAARNEQARAAEELGSRRAGQKRQPA
jgi:hypothetical protein